MGMKDVNGDGYRERPDGEKFNPTYIYTNASGLNVTPELEIVIQNWKEVGLNVQLKMVDRSLHDTRVEGNNFDISSWNGLVMPLAIGSGHIGKYYAPIANPHLSPWPLWVSWYNTNGKKGEEPPQKIKELLDASETIRTATDTAKRKAAVDKLMKAEAENLWVIGTVGILPKPILVSNNLKNFPDTGLFGWSVRVSRLVYPVQFYLDQ